MPFVIDLSGRNAVVTGAGSGLGAGIAKMLAEARCDVVGCGSRPCESAGAEAFVESVRAYDRRAEYFPCDVTQPDAIERFSRQTAEVFNHVDVLVSNAGQDVHTDSRECDLATWEHNYKKSEDLLAQFAKNRPAGRLGTPEKVGALCVFLASDYAAYITGNTILIDGGKTVTAG